MYYTLELSSDTNIIGSQYPQIQKMKSGYNYDGPNSVYKVGRCYQSLPNFIPDFDSFVLHSRAKPTDFLSNVFTGPWGYIVSEKVKKILLNFKLPLHDFYPIKLNYRKQQLDNYYWFHIVCDLTDIVDYPASTFFIYKDYSYDLGDIQISSKEYLMAKRKQIEEQNKGHNITIWAKKIQLTKMIEYDLFHIGRFDSDKYIT